MSSKTEPDEPATPWLSAPVALSTAAGVVEPSAGFAAVEAERYEGAARIGAGGMGLVVVAHDQRLRRDVALKAPRDDVPGAAGRLEREARITARLDHPGVVPIYDAGVRPDGSPYYAMRLVRGRSLEETLAAEQSLEGRLRYLRHVLAASEAVAYAHRLGVVHRDLTPRNIMVGDLGETQVVDWGLAAPTDAAWARELGPLVLGSGAPTDRAGTPAYMAPEQGEGCAPDPRADVWGLGAVLYRLVAGEAPFSGGSAASVVNAAAAGLVAKLAGPAELSAIVRRAMARQPEDRYPTAREFAQDVEAYLDGRRVSAHPYSPGELARRLVKAWRVPLRVAGVAAALLVALALVSARRIVAERDRALAAEGAASRARVASDASLVVAYAAHAEVALEHRRDPEAALLARAALTLGEDASARGVQMALDGPTPRCVARTELPPCPTWTFGPDGALGLCLTTTTTVWRLPAGERGPVLPVTARRAAFAGSRVVIVGTDRSTHWFDPVSGDAVARATTGGLDKIDRLVGGEGAGLAMWGDRAALLLPGQRPEPVEPCDGSMSMGGVVLTEPATLLDRALVRGPYALVICEDGRLVRIARDVAPFTLATRLERDEMGGALDLLPSGEVAMASVKGHLTLLGLSSGAVERRSLQLVGANGLVVSRAGRMAVVSPAEGARVLAPGSGEAEHVFPRVDSDAVRWAGEELVLLGQRGYTRWTVPEAPLRRLSTGRAGVSHLATGGDTVALALGDGTVMVARPGAAPRTVRVSVEVVKAAALSPDGRSLYAVGGGIQGVWTESPDGQTEVIPCTGQPSRRVGVLSDGDLIVAGWVRGARCNRSGSAPLAGPSRDLDLSPDRRRYVFLGENGDVVVGEVGEVGEAGEAPRGLGSYPGAVATTIANSGELLVGLADRVTWLDGSGARRLEFPVPARVSDVALVDGRAAVGALDGALRVYDVAGQLVAQVRLHDERIAALAVVERGVWTGSWDGTARRVGLTPTVPAEDPAQLTLSDVLR